MENGSTEFLPVANFPAGNASYFDGTSAIYVQKLNRIYIFGGYTDSVNGSITLHDSIWYIEM
jgi:hypothetical protein